MTVDPSHAFRALASLACAFAVTALVGHFLGYPAAPEALLEFQRRSAEFVAAHPEIPKSSYHVAMAHLTDEPLPPKPPEFIALLQWHWIALGVFTFGSLLVFRPRVRELAVIHLSAGAILLFAAGIKLFVAIAFATALYLLVLLAFRARSGKTSAA
jgi:hypothetical protein